MEARSTGLPDNRLQPISTPSDRSLNSGLRARTMEKPGRSREVMLGRLKREMPDRKEAIRKHLETTRAILLGVVSRLSAEDWNRPVASSEGAWTAQQALAHLATAEAGQIAIGRRMLTGEARLRDDFDLNYWNQRQVGKLKGWWPA